MSYVTSTFSYGSDAISDLWFQWMSLDISFLNRYMCLSFLILSRMRRWHSILKLGEEWMRLSEGVFNEKVLPYLMQVRGSKGLFLYIKSLKHESVKVWKCGSVTTP